MQVGTSSATQVESTYKLRTLDEPPAMYVTLSLGPNLDFLTGWKNRMQGSWIPDGTGSNHASTSTPG